MVNQKCSNCVIGDHFEIANPNCDCYCHVDNSKENSKEMELYEYGKTGEEAFKDSVKPKEEFPKATSEEISFYIKSLGKLKKSLNPITSNNDKEAIENMNNIFLQFLASVGLVSYNSEEFQKLIYNVKQVLHLINRTTGLMDMYLIGVAIGFFLAKPEMFPIIEETEEEKV